MVLHPPSDKVVGVGKIIDEDTRFVVQFDTVLRTPVVANNNGNHTVMTVILLSSELTGLVENCVGRQDTRVIKVALLTELTVPQVINLRNVFVFGGTVVDAQSSRYPSR